MADNIINITSHQDSDFILFLKSQGIRITYEIMTFKHISSLRCDICNRNISPFDDHYEFHDICERVEMFAEHYIQKHSHLRLIKAGSMDEWRNEHRIKEFNRTYAMLQQLLIYARNWNSKGCKLKRGSAIWSLQKEFQIPLIVLTRILEQPEPTLGELAYSYVESINGLPSWAK